MLIQTVPQGTEVCGKLSHGRMSQLRIKAAFQMHDDETIRSSLFPNRIRPLNYPQTPATPKTLATPKQNTDLLLSLARKPYLSCTSSELWLGRYSDPAV